MVTLEKTELTFRVITEIPRMTETSTIMQTITDITTIKFDGSGHYRRSHFLDENMLIMLMFFVVLCSPKAYADYSTRCVDMGGGYVNCNTRQSGLQVYQSSPNNTAGDSVNGFMNGFMQGQQIRAQRQQMELMQQQAELIEAQRRQFEQSSHQTERRYKPDDPDEYILSGDYLEEENEEES